MARPSLSASVIVLIPLAAMPFACASSTFTTTSSGGDSGGAGGSSSSMSSSKASSSAMSSSSTGMGPCTSAADCAGMSDTCNVGTCVNGACTKMPANEGGACDDGKFCTSNDSCQAGQCAGGTPTVCNSSDSCHLATCDVATDKCVETAGNDGGQCDDMDPCTVSSTCLSGMCMAGPQVDCSFLNTTCTVGQCDPVQGCIAVPGNDGMPCDDGLFCTVSDACANGKCTGQPNNCAQVGNSCQIGQCDEVNKICTPKPANDGAACDDGNPCTSGETCSGGNCVGGAPANNGGKCDDKNACTTNDICANGVCVGGAMIVNCINGDGCCPAGCNVAGDSDCSLTKWSEGTQAWPDEACNPTFSFGGCNTNAQADADAWATAVCKNNGYSSGIWTGNKKPGCAGQISMWCQGQIPCNQSYENFCQQGDQTQVEFTCFP